MSDTIARVLGDQLSTALGERVVVDGRPGAGGMVSMEIAAKATPDGHTIYLAQPVVSIAAAIDFIEEMKAGQRRSISPRRRRGTAGGTATAASRSFASSTG